MKERIIDFLLKSADPSIVLRVNKEVLQSLSPVEEAELLNRISAQKNIQTILHAQKADGWIGDNFHGRGGGAGMFDNMEVGLRYLVEKGFPAENRHVRDAVFAFLSDAPAFGEFRQGAPPDDYDYTAFGLYLLRTSTIVSAGYEYGLPQNDYIDTRHDVAFALKTFANVLQFASLDDAVDVGRKKLCFKKGVLWPCYYDLRILAHSQSWRTDSNISLLADSLNHLFSFRHYQDRCVYTYKKGAFRSPCGAFIHEGLYNLGIPSDDYVQFELLEMFARCGIMERVNFVRQKYERLLSLVDPDLNVNYKTAPGDRNWGPYGGFALEENWRTKSKKQCDMLFRILLIMHYAEYDSD